MISNYHHYIEWIMSPIEKELNIYIQTFIDCDTSALNTEVIASRLRSARDKLGRSISNYSENAFEP